MSNALSLEFQSKDLFGLSFFTNGIPLIDEIIIKNNCEYNLKNLEVEVVSSPSFFSVFSKKITDISSERYAAVNTCDLDIDVTKLMYISKPVSTVITVKVKSSGEILASTSRNLLLLPHDHIPPISAYTEIISSFVTPFQHEINALTVKVEEKLRNQTVVPVNRDMWVYDDRNVTEIIIKAIYETVKDLRITVNTVSSFSDSSPTKVKLPENVLKIRNGNALEISLLVCSLAENLGFSPFIVITSDTALLGIFYTPDSFDSCVIDSKRDLSGLTNGKCERFCLIDTTSLVSGLNISFDDSLLSAQKLFDKCDNPIIIDISHSRRNGYLPLPSRVYQHGNVIFESSPSGEFYGADDSDFDTSVLNDSKCFSEFVKGSILSKKDKEKLLNAEPRNSVFLIGNSKFIFSKMIINGTVIVRSLPIGEVVPDKDDIFPQLSLLNDSINTSDMSGSINAIHSKDSFIRRMSCVVEDAKNNGSAICVSLGSFNYFRNNKRICSPLFYLPVELEMQQDQTVTVKLLDSKININPVAVNALSKKGIDVSAFDFSENTIDVFSRFADNMRKLLEDTDVEYYDTVTIIAMNTDGEKLCSIARPDYFEKSGILSKIFKDNLIINNTDSTLGSILTPFSLDSAQKHAVDLSCNNECTVIKCINGSGKTLVASSVAFNKISRGDKVLYITDSDSNLNDFLHYANKSEFSEYVLNADSCEYETDLSSYSFSNTNDGYSSDHLSELIAEQNRYYENLHKVNEIGFSLYEAASQYERYRSFPYSVNFSNDEISTLSRNDVVTWLDCVSSLAKAGADCKEPFSNPLSVIKETEFSYDFKSKATILLNNHSTLTKNFLTFQEQLTEFLCLEVPVLKEKQTVALMKLLESIANDGHKIHYGIFGRESAESDFSRIETLTLKCDDIFELKGYIEKNFVPDVISIDCDSLLNEWRNALSKFAFARNASLNSVKNKLKIYCLDSKFINNENFIEAVNKISRYKNAYKEASECSALVQQVTGIDLKRSFELNEFDVFEHLKEIVFASRKYLSLLSEMFDGEKVSKDIVLHHGSIFADKEKLVEDVLVYSDRFGSYYREYVSSEESLAKLLKIDLPSIKDENRKIWYYFVTQLLQRMIDNIDLLKYWCNWNVEKEKAIKIGLEKVISLYESEHLSSSDIKNAFLKGFFKSVTEYFLSVENSVSQFLSDVQDDKISEIHSLLDLHRKNLYGELKNNVNQRFSQFISENYSSVDDAFTVLRTVLKTGFAAITDDTTVKLLQTSKPCFVCKSSKFLSKFSILPEFDTVIFDLTSKNQYAEICILLPLAKNAVIFDDIATYPSRSFADVLVSCGAASTELNCLYLSGYPVHIVNSLLYDDSFSVFPMSQKKRTGINVVKQSGTYDVKGTRVNVVEASAAVDEIVRTKSEDPSATVGVYTTTVQQSSLIEMLYKKRSAASGSMFSKKSDILVRSLLDRKYISCDYVIFSTVLSANEKSRYGDRITKSIPELSGRNGVVALKNVFLSAKKELTVITSLTNKDLTEFKTTEYSYCVFKNIMTRLLSEDDELFSREINTLSSNENPIIREVSNHIESLGYKADLNVGANDCKVDIAIREKSGTHYLLGILFDESVYINGDDFVARDVIINGLEVIGNWKLLRIYTVDWFENRTKQLDAVSSALNGDSFQTIFTDTME